MVFGAWNYNIRLIVHVMKYFLTFVHATWFKLICMHYEMSVTHLNIQHVMELLWAMNSLKYCACIIISRRSHMLRGMFSVCSCACFPHTPLLVSFLHLQSRVDGLICSAWIYPCIYSFISSASLSGSCLHFHSWHPPTPPFQNNIWVAPHCAHLCVCVCLWGIVGVTGLPVNALWLLTCMSKFREV